MCRRLGVGLHEKCQTQKFTLSEARKSKGARGKRPKALSEFGKQLIEKQKVRFSYGITERQLANSVDEASHAKHMAPALALFSHLESRLDNVVYRLGIAHTRLLARQLVSHGHITVGGRKVTIPSFTVKKGDQISIREGSKKSSLFQDLPKKLKNYSQPEWLSFDAEKALATVVGAPTAIDQFFNLNSVFEFYSR